MKKQRKVKLRVLNKITEDWSLNYTKGQKHSPFLRQLKNEGEKDEEVLADGIPVGNYNLILQRPREGS